MLIPDIKEGKIPATGLPPVFFIDKETVTTSPIRKEAGEVLMEQVRAPGEAATMAMDTVVEVLPMCALSGVLSPEACAVKVAVPAPLRE